VTANGRWLLLSLIALHTVDGRLALVNPEQITQVREPLPEGHSGRQMTNGVQCIVTFVDRTYAAVRENCVKVYQAIETLERGGLAVEKPGKGTKGGNSDNASAVAGGGGGGSAAGSRDTGSGTSVANAGGGGTGGSGSAGGGGSGGANGGGVGSGGDGGSGNGGGGGGGNNGRGHSDNGNHGQGNNGKGGKK